jgi:guanylate kinase
MSTVFIVSAPSGSGKSTLVNELFKMVHGLEFSISYTTRPPRGSEQSGKEYFFVSEPEFETMIAAGEFLEYAKYDEHHYGTARRFLRDAENRGLDLLLDIDVQGAAQVKGNHPDAVSIFILPPGREQLEWRLRTRGQNSEEEISRRLETARREIEQYSRYDYILINNVLEQSADELKAIVLAERLAETIRNRGVPPTPEEVRVLETAEASRLERARERVQPILASFGTVPIETK